MLAVNWTPLRKKGQKRKHPGGGSAEEEGGGGGETRGLLYRFVLRKENLEHLDALTQLARALRTSPSALGHAGVKDRRALTYQYLTARLPAPPERAAALLASVHVPGACSDACMLLVECCGTLRQQALLSCACLSAHPQQESTWGSWRRAGRGPYSQGRARATPSASEFAGSALP